MPSEYSWPVWRHSDLGPLYGQSKNADCRIKSINAGNAAPFFQTSGCSPAEWRSSLYPHIFFHIYHALPGFPWTAPSWNALYGKVSCCFTLKPSHTSKNGATGSVFASYSSANVFPSVPVLPFRYIFFSFTIDVWDGECQFIYVIILFPFLQPVW